MAQKSQLKELVLERGFSIDMTPKYHCELVSLERRWGRSKWHCRCHCKHNYAALLKVVPHSLISEEVMPMQLLRKYFRKSREYTDTYRVGVDAGQAEKSVKVYKSHRTPPASDSTGAPPAKPWGKKKVLAAAHKFKDISDTWDAGLFVSFMHCSTGFEFVLCPCVSFICC